MMPYGSYQLYQIERPKSAAEIRRASQQQGELSRSLSTVWRNAKRRTGTALALVGRGRVLPARLPAELPSCEFLERHAE
jgi:hypothetical protein